MSTRWLFWTLAVDLCISKTYNVYVLWSLQCKQFVRISLICTACIFTLLTKEIALFVNFTKMKRGQLSEYSVILIVFQLSFWLQSHLENFLHMLCRCCGHLKCSPGSDLSSALWIITVRHIEKVLHTPFRLTVKKRTPESAFDLYFSDSKSLFWVTLTHP